MLYSSGRQHRITLAPIKSRPSNGLKGQVCAWPSAYL